MAHKVKGFIPSVRGKDGDVFERIYSLCKPNWNKAFSTSREEIKQFENKHLKQSEPESFPAGLLGWQMSGKGGGR